MLIQIPLLGGQVAWVRVCVLFIQLSQVITPPASPSPPWVCLARGCVGISEKCVAQNMNGRAKYRFKCGAPTPVLTNVYGVWVLVWVCVCGGVWVCGCGGVWVCVCMCEFVWVCVCPVDIPIYSCA